VQPGRAAGLVYALAAYVVAVRSLVYLVCFLENFWVRRTIDTGAVSPPLTAAAVDAGLFALFALSHSAMAMPAAKRRIGRALPAELERSTYVLVAGATLALLFWRWRPLPAAVWHVAPPIARGALRGLGAAGWLLAVVAMRTLGHARLFGLAQAWRWARGREPQPSRLVERGIYRVIRHPLNLGFVLGIWGTPVMSAGRLLFAVVATLYVAVGMRLEEQHLRERFGSAWDGYRARVPALLPRVPGAAASRGSAAD